MNVVEQKAQMRNFDNVIVGAIKDGREIAVRYVDETELLWPPDCTHMNPVGEMSDDEVIDFWMQLAIGVGNGKIGEPHSSLYKAAEQRYRYMPLVVTNAVYGMSGSGFTDSKRYAAHQSRLKLYVYEMVLISFYRTLKLIAEQVKDHETLDVILARLRDTSDLDSVIPEKVVYEASDPEVPEVPNYLMERLAKIREARPEIEAAVNEAMEKLRSNIKLKDLVSFSDVATRMVGSHRSQILEFAVAKNDPRAVAELLRFYGIDDPDAYWANIVSKLKEEINYGED